MTEMFTVEAEVIAELRETGRLVIIPVHGPIDTESEEV